MHLFTPTASGWKPARTPEVNRSLRNTDRQTMLCADGQIIAMVAAKKNIQKARSGRGRDLESTRPLSREMATAASAMALQTPYTQFAANQRVDAHSSKYSLSD